MCNCGIKMNTEDDEFVQFYRAHMDYQELISMEIENPGINDDEHRHKKEELLKKIAMYDKEVGERAARSKKWRRVK